VKNPARFVNRIIRRGKILNSILSPRLDLNFIFDLSLMAATLNLYQTSLFQSNYLLQVFIIIMLAI